MKVELVGCIVKRGQGDTCLKMAAKKGVNGGTVIRGEGTVQGRVLNKLGLDKVRKEIAVFISDESTAQTAMMHIADTMGMTRKNKGICFRLPLAGAMGLVKQQAADQSELIDPADSQGFDQEWNQMENKGIDTKEPDNMFQAIVVITKEGQSEIVMEAAQAAGAQGGTVIQAHGAGGYETKKVFNMEIEPEKDMVLIISSRDQTKAITTEVNKVLGLEKPNSGILFVADLSETIGVI
ncbi:P-II family nitrogen regulator [Alkalibacterium sp. m-11]|uniref:P-II family nitrogen regulator n=1 Tax=Alkalibacterium indicireducens TaxID=398758 RepID=A0ABN1B1Z4_9LACT